MNSSLSLDTQAALLLTAPLMADGRSAAAETLTPGEFNRLARALREDRYALSNLLAPEAGEIVAQCLGAFDHARLERLLGRGFLLGQALERWKARSIWVAGRSDEAYPGRLRDRLGDEAPPILYGCGDASLLETGGLAVVGSRHVDDPLVQYTEAVGRLAAAARRTVVSGGARGIDQAAMRGALQEGGRVAGVLADSLERAAMAREHREVLMDGRLVLVSPYDPAAGFNVGHAMQRNKFIYALADAALVVSSDYEKGGTWAGAVEQLEKLRLVPVYVRAEGEASKGLDALRKKGALPWPEPAGPDALEEALSVKVEPGPELPEQGYLFLGTDVPANSAEAQPSKKRARKSKG